MPQSEFNSTTQVHVQHIPWTGVHVRSLIKQCMRGYWVKQEQETGPLVDPATGRINYRGPVLTGWISGLRWGPDQSEAKATQSDSYYCPLEHILGPLGCIRVWCASLYQASHNSCIRTGFTNNDFPNAAFDTVTFFFSPNLDIFLIFFISYAALSPSVSASCHWGQCYLFRLWHTLQSREAHGRAHERAWHNGVPPATVMTGFSASTPWTSLSFHTTSNSCKWLSSKSQGVYSPHDRVITALKTNTRHNNYFCSTSTCKMCQGCSCIHTFKSHEGILWALSPV